MQAQKECLDKLMANARTVHLTELYFKMIYAIDQERRQTRPNQAVIRSCEETKSLIYRAVSDRN